MHLKYKYYFGYSFWQFSYFWVIRHYIFCVSKCFIVFQCLKTARGNHYTQTASRVTYIISRNDTLVVVTRSRCVESDSDKSRFYLFIFAQYVPVQLPRYLAHYNCLLFSPGTWFYIDQRCKTEYSPFVSTHIHTPQERLKVLKVQKINVK